MNTSFSLVRDEDTTISDMQVSFSFQQLVYHYFINSLAEAALSVVSGAVSTGLQQPVAATGLAF